MQQSRISQYLLPFISIPTASVVPVFGNDVVPLWVCPVYAKQKLRRIFLFNQFDRLLSLSLVLPIFSLI
ncbi:Uncharacterised protein [Vibrio cholerae]|uniref:Uncharacterized protein n=1 Tax=Vibrio cholerae TaxID=666 RepID=A0A655R024_VIBCL|nr:Uncharacterised protein [Vibrio cholerae]